MKKLLLIALLIVGCEFDFPSHSGLSSPSLQYEWFYYFNTETNSRLCFTTIDSCDVNTNYVSHTCDEINTTDPSFGFNCRNHNNSGNNSYIDACILYQCKYELLP